MSYGDLREYLDVLRANGKLKSIDAEVDKDWEIAAVARVAFQDIEQDQRPALIFNNVRGYDIPVVVGILGGSRSIYALAAGSDESDIQEHWARAQMNPVAPVVVDTGPVKENIISDPKQIDMNKFPVPTWTVNHDPAPYLTSPFVFTKGIAEDGQNIGVYRCMLRDETTMGVYINHKSQHGYRHVEQWTEAGQPTPVAVVLGTDPSVGLAAVSRIPYGVDELSVAGGLRGKPVEIVKCETVDLYVPSTAEIVIEGFIRPGVMEPEGPFGEYPGFMGPETKSFVMDITCVTHRNQPIFQAFLSQMPPSESSMIRCIGREAALYKHLAKDLRLPVTDVHLLEAGGAAAYLAISMKKAYAGQVRQTMLAAWGFDGTLGKICVVVDDDIDIRDQFMLNWAMSWCVQPHKDVFVIEDLPAVKLDPSLAPASAPQNDPRRMSSSKLGIDATRKHEFPPAAIPPKEHLTLVREHWSKYWV